MKKVLLSMPWPPEMVTELDQYLSSMKQNGFEVILDSKQQRLTEQELIARWPGIYAHVCGADQMTAKAIASADALKIISRIGVGFDSVDIPSATAKGIAVGTTPGAGAETVAEFAFAMMIALSRGVKKIDRDVREGKWTKTAGRSLYRKTLGIIGFGNIGKQLSKIVSGFDMKILAYDPYPDYDYAAAHNITYTTVNQIIENADFISLHVPLNDETRNMLDANAFKRMKPSCQIVNCARGGIINEQDLYEALKSGKIAGAALDVWENEPADLSSPLFTLDNLLVSAHNAGTSLEGKNKVVEAALRNVVEYSQGHTFRGLLNPEVMEVVKA